MAVISFASHIVLAYENAERQLKLLRHADHEHPLQPLAREVRSVNSD
jgi:hypothetical protein